MGMYIITDDLALAVYYGDSTASGENDRGIIIFCIIVDAAILEADKDEINYTLVYLNLGQEINDINKPNFGRVTKTYSMC